MNKPGLKTNFTRLLTKGFLLASLLIFLTAGDSMASIGCDLNDPDRDVPRLFPDSTRYETVYASIGNYGGPRLLKKIEERLNIRYHTVYAPLDVPYTLYEIYNGKKLIGYIHGVNQKGQYGGNQVFVALDLTGKIKSFYIQKMSGRSAHKLRDAKFGRQFVGLSLKDFDAFDPVNGTGSGRLAAIRNPAPEAETDFLSVLRALKKNLILMDEFVYSANRRIQ